MPKEYQLKIFQMGEQTEETDFMDADSIIEELLCYLSDEYVQYEVESKEVDE